MYNNYIAIGLPLDWRQGTQETKQSSLRLRFAHGVGKRALSNHAFLTRCWLASVAVNMRMHRKAISKYKFIAYIYIYIHNMHLDNI